jgi:hypothetical protein
MWWTSTECRSKVDLCGRLTDCYQAGRLGPCQLSGGAWRLTPGDHGAERDTSLREGTAGSAMSKVEERNPVVLHESPQANGMSSVG